jgi:hypothetical protein
MGVQFLIFGEGDPAGEALEVGAGGPANGTRWSSKVEGWMRGWIPNVSNKVGRRFIRRKHTQRERLLGSDRAVGYGGIEGGNLGD